MIQWLLGAALAGPPVELPDVPWERARLVEVADARRLALFHGEDEAVLVDPLSGRKGLTLERVADLVSVDVDGDGRVDLVQCGPDGTRAWYGPDRIQLREAPCRALAVVHADRDLLIVVEERARRFGLGVGGPVDLGTFGADLPEGPVRAWASGDAIALAHEEGLELWGPFGQRLFHTAEAVDGAGRLTEGWAWSAGGAVSGAAEGRWFPDARSLVALDHDADGHPEAAALHPEARLLGWLEDGVERASPLPFEPRALVVGDLTDDGGEDLLVLGADAMQLFPAAGPSPSAQTVEVLQAPAPSRPFFGVPTPLFQGTSGGLASGREAPRATMVGGFGLALGSTPTGAEGIGASPAGFAVLERRTRTIHSWIGADSAPLIIQLGDVGLVHLLDLSAGASIGNPHLRAGPFASVGTTGVGAGARVSWLPLETRSGVLHGLEWRAVVHASPANLSTPSGEVFLTWATAIPMGGEAGFERSLPGVLARAPGDRPERLGVCRRFGMGLGAAGGASDVDNAWEFVGRRLQFDISATPAATAWCESGSGAHDLFLSVDSAPWFRYRVPVAGGGDDFEVRHMGSVSAGYAFGGDTLRVGPMASAGVWMLGAGARLAFTPIAIPGAGRHGLEARGLFLWPSADAFQVALFYTSFFDPRR